MAYFWWRVFKGDVIGGITRKIRRGRGIFLDDSVHDNAEYHVVRKGLDQNAINDFFISHGFDCTILDYFSTQSRLFQPIGSRLGIRNSFGILAQKIDQGIPG